MKNIELSKQIITQCLENGVSEFCLCAGARNAPLVQVLSFAKNVKIYHFFEERSAAFFALGRTGESGKPVAVVTTSGTAVAELLPATIEAYYSLVPLLLITADRPRSYRMTGAPQSIEQIGIFSHYIEGSADLERETLNLTSWDQNFTFHLNVCFDEPVLDETVTAWEPQFQLRKRELPKLGSLQKKTLNQPLVILGPLKESEFESLVPHLLRWQAPIYAEGMSQLKGDSRLQSLLLQGSDHLLKKYFEKKFFKSLLRVGAVPTTRLWRDLETTLIDVPVYSISNAEFKGLSRRTHHFVGLHLLETFSGEWSEDFRDEVFETDFQSRTKILDLFQKYPQSEPAMIFELAQKIQNQNVYVGNSLPIREWDLVTGKSLQFEKIWGNRGANGIDGQISSFLGGLKVDVENWGLFGDLTAMYDLVSFWIKDQLQVRNWNVVVINNKGGMIFNNIFHNETFLNRHNQSFRSIADFWKMEYQMWSSIPADVSCKNPRLIELTPSAEQTELFWKMLTQ